METIFLDDYLTNGILIEKDFTKKIKNIDWEKYKDKRVLIKGCASVPIPTWAYLIIASRLTLHAKQILFGLLNKIEPKKSIFH